MTMIEQPLPSQPRSQLEIIQKKLQRKILLNPGPGTTSWQVKSALLVEDICPREREISELQMDVRRKVLQVVDGGRDYEAILIPGHGTFAVEAALVSCYDDRHPGKILILENGAYGVRMQEICLSFGIPHEVLSFPWGRPIDPEVVEDLLKQKKNHKQENYFQVTCFVHHETTVGLLNPLPQLSELAQKYQLRLLVDAMSSYAGIPINVQNTPVDFLISSSNKCIQGFAGIGLVVAKAESLKLTQNYRTRHYSLNLWKNYISQKDKNEFWFTPPVQILYGLNAALDEFLAEGGEQRHQRYSTLYHILTREMQRMGFEFMVPAHWHSQLLTAFKEPQHPNYNFTHMHDFLLQRGCTIYPGKVQNVQSFRVANIGDLYPEDIYLFITHLEEYMHAHSITLLRH